MDLKDIKAIIDLMKRNSIAEFELEREDFKIRLKRGALNGGGGGGGAMEDALAPGLPMAAASVPSQAVVVAAGAPAAGVSKSNEVEIKSPMIGSFYRSPSPESAPFIEVGAEVNPESVVCIIEAMKVMNEIKAEVKGVITQVLVENGKPVEFGQPLFKVRPA